MQGWWCEAPADGARPATAGAAAARATPISSGDHRRQTKQAHPMRASPSHETNSHHPAAALKTQHSAAAARCTAARPGEARAQAENSSGHCGSPIVTQTLNRSQRCAVAACRLFYWNSSCTGQPGVRICLAANLGSLHICNAPPARLTAGAVARLLPDDSLASSLTARTPAATGCAVAASRDEPHAPHY